MGKKAQNPFDSLTPREREIAQLLGSGGRNRTAAKILGISPRTVEVHRARLLEKLGLKRVSGIKALAEAHNFSIEFAGKPFDWTLPARISPAKHLEAPPFSESEEQHPTATARFLMDTVLDSLAGSVIGAPVWAHGQMCEDYVGVEITKPDGTRWALWFDRDAGMNGPGWVRVEESWIDLTTTDSET